MTMSPAERAAGASDQRHEDAMGRLAPLTPTSLRDEARRAIRAGIIAGNIRPAR